MPTPEEIAERKAERAYNIKFALWVIVGFLAFVMFLAWSDVGTDPNSPWNDVEIEQPCSNATPSGC